MQWSRAFYEREPGRWVAGLPCPAACCPPQLVPQAPGHRRGCTARVPVERDDSAWRWQAAKPVAAWRTADRIFYSYSRKCCKRWRVIRAEIAIRGEPVGRKTIFSCCCGHEAMPLGCSAGDSLHACTGGYPGWRRGVQAQQMRCRSSQPVQTPHRWRDTWRGADWPSVSALGWRLGANARPLSSQGQPVGTVQAVSWEDFHSCQRSIYMR